MKKSKGKKIFILAIPIIAIIAVFMFFSCGRSPIVQNVPKRKAATGEKWTVMIYMCGSTLEEEYSRSGEVLSELSYDLPENINVLVETGGSRAWSVDDIYSDYLQDFQVQKNGIHLVHRKKAASMGESSTLKSFLKWGIESYPAEHYVSVIWNHGGGPIGGVAYDSTDNYNSLSLNELTSALGGLGVKLDIVGFDASMTSNLETAAAISLYADYMVGSEDIMPMCGWDYRELFKFLSDNPSSSVLDVCKNICDGVKDNADEPDSESVSMAAVDLTKETMLSLAFEGMSKNMADSAEDLPSLRNILSSLESIKYMGGNSAWEGYSNLVDVREFADAVCAQMGKQALSINNAIDSMVAYKAMSEYHENSSGLGVYYPHSKSTSEISKYKNICMSGSYMEFIEKTCAAVAVPKRDFNYTDTLSWQQYNEIVASAVNEASADATGNYFLTVSNPEIITGASVSCYMRDKKSEKYIYLGRDNNVEYDPANGRYSYVFSGKMPRLNGSPIAMYLVSESKQYRIYSIPVIYNGEMGNIRVIKNKDDEYEILGVWKGIGKYSGMAYRKYTKIQSGDTIIPIYEIYGEESGKYIEGEMIKVGFGGIKITDKAMSNDDYVVSYFIKDVFDNTYESSLANLTAENGKVKITTS